MAVIRQDQYSIELKDGVTTQWSQIEKNVEEGAKNIESSIGGMTGANEKYAKSTQKLSEFIREQRQEDRRDSFLFRSMKDSIGAAGLALTAFGVTSDGSMKQVSDSLNKGFVAFQGVDFMLATLGLAGPWGMAISGAAGLAAVFMGMKDDTEAIKKQVDETVKKLSGYSSSKLSNVQDEQDAIIKNAEEQIAKLRKEKGEGFYKRSDEYAGFKKIIDDANALANLAAKEKTKRAEEYEQKGKILQIEERITELTNQRNESKSDADITRIGKEIAKLQKELGYLNDPYLSSKEKMDRGRVVAEEAKRLEKAKFDALISLVRDENDRLFLVESKKHNDTIAQYEHEKVLYPELVRQINDAIEIEEQRHQAEMEKIQSVVRVSMKVREVTDKVDERGNQFAGISDLQIITEEQPQLLMGLNALQSGFDNLGSAIRLKFIDELVEGNSVAQRFIGGVLQGLEQIGVKIASSAIEAGILSMITGGGFGSIFGELSGLKFASGGVISEPVVGVGARTGRGYLMGEAGPERIAPLTSFGNVATPMVIRVEGELRGVGRDMYATIVQNVLHDRKLGGQL